MERVIAGRYALGPVLGTGGMSAVFSAHDRRLDRTVAVKLVPVEGTEPAARTRFIREARSAAGFSHPNAVAVYDAGEADGQLYLVMERIEGQSLAKILDDEGALALEEASAIATSVLAALASAHRAGIVHRDVKPSNILIADDGTVKLMDFGIAKRLDDLTSDVTRAGELVGTPKYLAPEQLEGGGAGPATDLYAVGVVLYEMLTGLAPFDADTPIATALAHRNAPVPDVRTLRPDVPDQLAATIRTAMAKDPASRFAGADEMFEAIRNPAMAPIGVRALAGSVPEPTQILQPGGYDRRSVNPLWLGLLAALLAGGGVVVAAIVRDGDGGGGGASSATTSEPRISTTIGLTSTTISVSSTTLPVSTVAAIAMTTTAEQPPQIPTTVEGLIATLQSNQSAYGVRAPDVVERLDDIHGNGRRAANDAAELLDHADDWVEDGELEPVVLTMLEPVLGPIAAAADDDDDEDDDD